MRLWTVKSANGDIVFVHAANTEVATKIANALFSGADTVSSVNPVSPRDQVSGARVVALNPTTLQPVVVGRVSSGSPLGAFINSESKTPPEFIREFGDTAFNPGKVSGSAAPVYTPPSDDDGPIGEFPVPSDPVPSDNRSFLEAFQPGAAFRSALQGTNRDVTTSPFGRTISALEPFFQSAFLGDIAAGGGNIPLTGTVGEQGETLRGPFEQFVNQTGLGGLGRLGGQAFQALSATGGAPLTGGAEALRRSFATPQTQGERERAANLGLLAAANKFSPFAAFNLLPTGAEIARQAETAQFRDPGQDFLSFLRPSLGF